LVRERWPAIISVKGGPNPDLGWNHKMARKKVAITGKGTVGQGPHQPPPKLWGTV